MDSALWFSPFVIKSVRQGIYLNRVICPQEPHASPLEGGHGFQEYFSSDIMEFRNFLFCCPLIISHTQHQTLNNYSFVYASRACGPSVLNSSSQSSESHGNFVSSAVCVTFCGISAFKSLTAFATWGRYLSLSYKYPCSLKIRIASWYMQYSSWHEVGILDILVQWMIFVSLKFLQIYLSQINAASE